jgi:MoaA/NifB/PqqE/SkfB family radical SAM enzyme
VFVPLWKRSLNQLDSSIRRFASGASDEAFMGRLYQEMLCRAPDASALAAGTRKLGLGLFRRNHLRKEIASSSEYRTVTPPWKCALNQIDSSLRRFASGKSDGAFLDRLYEQMLGRRPDVGAVSNGMRNLSRGFLRRNSLRKQIISSSEYRAVTPLREIKSLLRYAPAPATARSLAASSPEEIWLELTTRCNMVPACAMCGYASADFPEPRINMDPKTWRTLLPLLRQARYVGLHGAGEPLLYPFLGDLMEALHPSPAVVGFNSNGHLLTAAVSRRLVEKGLGWISISLDAATAPTYLRIRRRRDFEALLSKIQTLRKIRDAAGSSRPQIEINMTLMRLNLPEAPAFVELAARLGADRVMFQEIQPGGSQRVEAPDGFLFDYREQELARESRRDDVLGKARERARSLDVQFNCEILYGSPSHEETSEASVATENPATVSPPPACAEPWKRLLFDVHGDAFVCCIQKTNKILLGQAPHDPFDEIWNGRRARLVREAMFEGPTPSCCIGCYRTS